MTDQRSLEPFRVVLGVVGVFSRASASYFHFLALSLVIFPPFYFHNYIIYLGGGGGRVEEEGGKEEVSFDAYQPRHRRRGNGFPGSR